MSDTDTAPEVVEPEAADTPEPEAAEAADAVEDTPAEPDKEAAKFRRKLRETEKERDTLAARVEALQRAQAETLLTASGVKPQAVWAVAELGDVLAEDGTIDTDKLDKAVATAREKFGIAKPAKGNLVRGVGNQPAGRPRLDAWREAFTPKR